ncbi:MAG: hypothetical protein OCD03_13450 [Hyphomicrobiales bacterium]
MKFITNQPPHIFETSRYRVEDEKVDELVEAKQYQAAIQLLNQMKLNYPDRLADTYIYLIWVYGQLNHSNKKLAQITEAAEKNIFFNLADNFFSDGCDETIDFQKLQKASDLGFTKLAAKNESELELYLPSDCFDGQLLLILHGDGSSNQSIKDIWPAQPYLKKNIAVAYLQAPNMAGSHHYSWTLDYVKSRAAIAEAFKWLQSQHKISTPHITLAGYSGGAMAGLSAVTHSAENPKHVLAFMPHNGNYIGKSQTDETDILIFKAENDKNIDELLASLTATRKIKQILLNNLDHDLPTDMASYILPYLNKSN